MDENETRDLLQELIANFGLSELTCRFRWAPGSVAMRDNRAVQHFASADFCPHRRSMEASLFLILIWSGVSHTSQSDTSQK